MTVHCSTTIVSFPFLLEPGIPEPSSSYKKKPSIDLGKWSPVETRTHLDGL